jgi:stage III sporulation protein AG
LGIINILAHTFEKGSGSKSGLPPGPNARNAGRWLVYGVAALVLLWALGSVWQGVSGLTSAAAGSSGPASGGTGFTGAAASGAGGASGQSGAGASTGENPRQYEQALAQELESMLSEVQGAGRVRVSVSLLRGPVYVFGTNTSEDTRQTEERESSGTLRTVTEVSTTREPVIVRNEAQAEQPIVSEEERPTISGVLILAEGASSSRVRLDLVRAVQALFPLPTHRITVLPMGR